MVTLKRFDDSSNKLRNEIAYSETLKLPVPIKKNKGSGVVEYQLYSIIVHNGEKLGNGHYFSYVRSPQNELLWYKADDNLVNRALTLEVLDHKKDAYIFFYRKVQSPPVIRTSTFSFSTPLDLTNELSYNQSMNPEDILNMYFGDNNGIESNANELRFNTSTISKKRILHDEDLKV